MAFLISACTANTGANPETATDRSGLGGGYPTGQVTDVANQGTGVSAGDLAPNFQLVWEDGTATTLRDYQGQPIMLNFWATWCGPCRLEMPEIVKSAEEHDDLVVLAINVQEDLEPVQAFAEDFQMSMPVVLDTDGKIRQLYQLRGMPTTVFIDADGNISTTWAGLLTPDKLTEFLDQIL